MSYKQRQHQAEKEAEKLLKKHLKSLGYNEEAQNFILELIKANIANYDQPEKAFEIVARKIITLVEYPFAECDLVGFGMRINPMAVFDEELNDELGICEKDFENRPEEKSCYLIEKEKLRNEIQTKRKADLGRLKEDGIYSKLRDNPCKTIRSFEFKKKGQLCPSCWQN